MKYSTQMEAARRNIITREMKIVAEKEHMHQEVLRQRIAEGSIVIPANKNHHALIPQGVGKGLRTKVNVNIGISKDCPDIDRELDKMRRAGELKADAIMDLSCWGKTAQFRKDLIGSSPLMIGTVPIYDAIGNREKGLMHLTANDFLQVVEEHVKDGVDFITIHAGLNRKTAERLKKNKRIANIVSRGGSLLFAWMEMTGQENPFYEYYDELLAICRTHDVTISLGDGCRPGALHDATDASQIEELITLGELTKRAWEKDVQVLIEGPGHMPLQEIETNMVLAKKLCHGAPFYVLGPLVTDTAPGYDHITSAIGGAIAASKGADFLCYVTPAEHLSLPDLRDMEEGIIAARIAAHAADIAKGIPGARDWDDAMSRARSSLDWNTMFDLAIDPAKAQAYRARSTPEKEETCTMCGEMCAIRSMNAILEGEKEILSSYGKPQPHLPEKEGEDAEKVIIL